MFGHREEVKGAQSCEAVAKLGQEFGVARQRYGVARNINNRARFAASDRCDDVAPSAGSGWIDDHYVGVRSMPGREPLFDRCPCGDGPMRGPRGSARKGARSLVTFYRASTRFVTPTASARNAANNPTPP